MIMMAEAIEPISTSLAVGIAAAVTGFLARYPNVLYYFQECCRPEWISYNKTGAYVICLICVYRRLSCFNRKCLFMAYIFVETF